MSIRRGEQAAAANVRNFEDLGKADPKREPASFVLFVPSKPALKVVAQDGKPLPAEHLISSVNLRVEAQGTEVGDTFRLLAMRKLDELPLM